MTSVLSPVSAPVLPAPCRVSVCDETPTGTQSNVRLLEFLENRVCVRDLIRERVYEEVRDHNAALTQAFSGLVAPDGGAVETRTGFHVPTPKTINRDAQFEKTLDAFARNRFFILVDNRQVEDLNDDIILHANTTVAFVKLVPLVGG